MDSSAYGSMSDVQSVVISYRGDMLKFESEIEESNFFLSDIMERSVAKS